MLELRRAKGGIHVTNSVENVTHSAPGMAYLLPIMIPNRIPEIEVF